MNELVVADKAAEWRKLKALVLDSISSPITKGVYNLGLDEFITWYTQEPRPGFTKATVAGWRVSLEAQKLGPVSINVRLTAVRKLTIGGCRQRTSGTGAGCVDLAHQRSPCPGSSALATGFALRQAEA